MTEQNNISTGIRIASMVFDHIIMTMISMVFFMPMMVDLFLSAFNISHKQAEINLNGPLVYIGLAGFAVYLCKDSINGRSIGKRIFNLQVIDTETEEAATPLKCFIRNICCIIWPVEAIVILFSPERRLGDRIARTKVVSYDPINIGQQNFSVKNIFLPLLLAYGLMLLFMLPLQGIKPIFATVKYDESSYNDAESKALEKLFADSCTCNVSASFNVYDKIENGSIKYISAIYMLKENYLKDEEKTKQVKQITERLLYSKYPKETFTGHAQYVFKTNGTIHAISNPIGKTTQTGKIRQHTISGSMDNLP